jgi:hypothetical protein
MQMDPNLIEAMRDWLTDNGVDDAELFSMGQIVSAVASRYTGGVDQFERDFLSRSR